MLRTKTGSTLTEKEKIFCEEYILDLNAAHAAERAGYSKESAATIAYHLKQRPEVEAYINKLIYERELRTRITVDQILLELAKIGFAEPGLSEGHPEELKESVPEPTAASTCKVVYKNELKGRTTTIQFNLPAKIAAIKLLGRHLGLFLTAAKTMVPKPNIIFPPVRQVVLH